METSMLPQIIGPVLVVIGLGILFNRDHYIKMWNSFVKDPDTVVSLIAPSTALVMGILVVLQHNVWEWSSALIITIVGWALILKGTSWLLIPNLHKCIMGSVSKHLPWFLIVDGIILLLAGGYLVYLGYFVNAG